MHRHRWTRRGVFAVLAMFAAIAPRSPHAAEPAADQPLEFRRYFVPADRPQDWPKRNVPYLPVDRQEFDQLLEAANSAPRGRRTSKATRVTRADYQAKLVEKDLLKGEARLEIAHAGEAAALLNLDPFGLALLGARWEDETAASLGLHASGKLAVLIDRPRTLIFDWSLRGRRDAGGSLVFLLDLPASEVCRLNLQLPESLVPSIAEGVATGAGGTRPGEWQFELGGRTRAALRLDAEDAHGRSRRFALLQEKTTYRFSPGGLDLAAQLKLDVHHEPLRRLRIDLDSPLRVVSVQYGGAELGWSSPTDEPSITIDFPEPLLGPGRVVTVTALAPLVVGRAWTLPRLRVRDVTWQEGDMTLWMPQSLGLDALLPQGCRQTKFSPRTAAPAGDGVELQLFSPEAAVEVQLSPRRQTGTLASGSTIRFAPDSVRAEFRGRFDFSAGEVFLLQADVGAGWQIESVTADRAGALASWAVDRADRSSLLAVHLAHPVTDSQPLELMITGRRPLPADFRFSSEMLTMLDFHDVVGGRRLMALEASGARRVSLEGADRPRLEPRDELTETERGLLASALSGIIFQVDSDQPDWNVAIEPQTPRYEGDLRVVVDVSGRRLTESYRIHCRPDGSRLDHLLLAFSQAREEGLRFTADDAVGTVIAERLNPRQQAARGLPQAGEVWLLRLPGAIERPFDIQGSRTLDFTADAAPALVSLPEAVSQQGIIEIRRQRDAPEIRSADRLEPAPLEPPPAGEYAALCAAFRYNPLEELGNASPAAVVLRPPGGADQPAQATVWRLSLQSYYTSSESSRHRAVFDIENHGLAQCVLRLPAGADFSWAKVDGEGIASPTAAGQLRITLPEKRKFPVVALEFVARGPPPGVAPSCEAPWPKIDLPVASRQWIISTANQFEPLIWTEGGVAWAARLLGPLAKPRGQRPFDATRLADWRSLAAGGGDATPERAARLLDALGRALSDGDPPPTTWGRLLAESATAQPALFKSLRIDSRSLAAAGIDPSSPRIAGRQPGAAGSESAAALAAQEMRRGGLAWLIDSGQVILTTRWAAAGSAGQPVEGGRSVVYSRTDARTGENPPSGEPSELLSLAEWQARPEMVWNQDGSASTAVVSDVASKSYRIAVGESGAASVRLVRRDVVVASGWALAAICIAVGACLARRPVLLSLMAGSAAVAATWSPPALLPLASGALAGSIFVVLWRLMAPARRAGTTAPRAEATAEASRGASSSIVGAALLLSLAAGARGDDAIGAPEPERPAVHRVFVPVDAAEKPTNRYQVPTDFLEELRRRASSAGAEPRGWLITGAAYRCTLAPEGDQVGVRDFSARYDLQLLSAEARVHVPADRRRAELLADSATLDGQPVELVWDDAGEALICNVVELGEHRLEFRLLPLVSDDSETRGFNLSIPRVAASTLELLLPVELATVEVPGIQGDLATSEGGRRVSAVIGPSESLVVRWAAQAAALPAVEIEELLWLKVRPGSVVLDVELNYTVMSGALRQIEFAADRRLRLLPCPAASKERTLPVDVDAPDAPQTTQLDLQRPVTGQGSLRLSFFLTGASGVGNVRLPTFHALQGRVARRWLAVTVDPGLEYEARGAEQLEALPAADFAAKWQEADAASLRDALAYRLTEDEAAWSLATRSREPRTTVKETLSLSFRRSTALVRYDAQLMTTAGYVFQHRLLVPTDLDIERIALEEEGVDRLARWARAEPGAVTVFLSRRITGSQQLTLWGRLPVGAGGRLDLPTITLDPGASAATVERAEVLDRSLHLYRQSSVDLALTKAAGLSELSQPAADRLDARLGRLVLSRAAGPVYSGVVVVSSNVPRITKVEQFTSLRYANQSWTAEIDYRFRAEEGLVDALRFDLPSAWAGKIELLSPPAVEDLSDQPGNGRKALTVRPLKPLTGDCQVKFRAPLKYLPGDAVAAPDIVALGMPAAERYWLLPRQVGLEAVNWDVQRMVAASLPEGSPPPSGAESSAVFHAVADHPQAVMSSVKAAVGVARVRLADVRLECGQAGGWRGAAAFDLEPGGRSSCLLRLAAGWRLLHVGVGGAGVTPLAKATGDWEVPLHSNRLPQRLEVTFSSAASVGPAEPASPLPVVSLEGWEVQETLLTIHAPEDCQALVAADRVDRAVCDSARLASAVSLIDLPDETVANTSHDHLAAWYLPWARWLVYCGRQAGVRESADGETATPFDQWLSQARRLRVEETLARIVDERPLALQTMEVWEQTHDASRATRFHWIGANGLMRVQLHRSWPRALLWRWNQTAVIVLLALAGMILPRFALLADMPRRWPHMLGVALGLGWWLCCQPSAAGWLLIAGSLLAALRSAVKPSWR